MPTFIHQRPDGTEKAYTVGAEPLIIGRESNAGILVDDAFISRAHCSIVWVNNRFILKDAGATNGTYCNGARIYESPLITGDRIQLGNTTLLFEADPISGNATLRQIPPRKTSLSQSDGDASPHQS